MRTRPVIFFALAAMCSQCFAQSVKDAPLTFIGLGAVHLGLSQAQLKSLGFKVSEEPSGYEECVEVTLNGDDKVLVMLENDRVTRVSSYDSTIKTKLGINVGSTEGQVKRAYAKNIMIRPHQYDDKGHYLITKSSNGKYAIVFETDGAHVTGIHAGLEASAQYVEGCL